MRWVSFIPSPARRIVLRAAQYDHLPVLITGETGAGKSRIAEWIHANSPRSRKPFRKVDPRTDVLTQILASSAGGTLVFEDFHLWGRPYLDLLLHLLRTRSVVVEGVRHMVHTRVIVTLAQGFESASPFWDFFQNSHIHLPPLVERLDEFEDIVLSLMNEAASDAQKLHLKGFDRLAWAKLKAHSWPGNIRELREVVRTAVAYARGDLVMAEDLPDLHLRMGLRSEMRTGTETAPSQTADLLSTDL